MERPPFEPSSPARFLARLAAGCVATIFAVLNPASPRADEVERPRALPRAHAHNDYHHRRPLLDALEHGFTSVEVDVFLVDGKLLVGHSRSELRPGRTIEALYLDPLRERVRRNKGSVHPDGGELTLLIDIKSDAGPTWLAIESVLEKYKEMISVVRDGRLEKRAVRAIVSGNRPRELMASRKTRWSGYDGRLADLDAEPAPDALFMPLVSDHWGRHFTWRGEGPMPPGERRRLVTIVEKAHARGQRVRFWATPEKESVWTELAAAGVDSINTDQLARLRTFLLARSKEREAGEKRKE